MERKALLSQTTKDLKKLAKEKNVKVTHRIEGKPRDLPKKVVVRKLLHEKFLPSAATASPQVKTIHDKFRVINIIFSEECCAMAAASTNALSREELDTGAHGDNSKFWKTVEKRFNGGFEPNSIDGPVFADKLHFNHPNFTTFEEIIDPQLHGTWSSGELRKMWKEIQSHG
jgi:hypothetical protein